VTGLPQAAWSARTWKNAGERPPAADVGTMASQGEQTRPAQGLNAHGVCTASATAAAPGPAEAPWSRDSCRLAGLSCASYAHRVGGAENPAQPRLRTGVPHSRLRVWAARPRRATGPRGDLLARLWGQVRQHGRWPWAQQLYSCGGITTNWHRWGCSNTEFTSLGSSLCTREPLRQARVWFCCPQAPAGNAWWPLNLMELMVRTTAAAGLLA
jgi:hypothetical protein